MASGLRSDPGCGSRIYTIIDCGVAVQVRIILTFSIHPACQRQQSGRGIAVEHHRHHRLPNRGGIVAGFSPAAQAGPTLDAIKARGLIKEGLRTGPGFHAPDSNGRGQGFFIDFGRAQAIAVSNDPEMVQFTSSSPLPFR